MVERCEGHRPALESQELVLVLSAMRHAEDLRAEGFEVEVRRATTYVEGIRSHVAAHGSSHVIALMPRDHGLEASLRDADLGVPLVLRDDGGPEGHFLLTREDFAGWAQGRDTLRMDTFYRWMRRRLDVLLDGGKPVGGKWSFDADNRKPAKGARPPALPTFAPDEITLEVMKEVDAWSTGWGDTAGFGWPVTRSDALRALDGFVSERLSRFGDFRMRWSRESPSSGTPVSPPRSIWTPHPTDLLKPPSAHTNAAKHR